MTNFLEKAAYSVHCIMCISFVYVRYFSLWVHQLLAITYIFTFLYTSYRKKSKTISNDKTSIFFFSGACCSKLTTSLVNVS